MSVRLKHVDEARRDATDRMRALVESEATIDRAVLIDDLFGKIRVVVWPSGVGAEGLRNRVDEALREVATPFWSGDVWVASTASEADRLVYDRAWEDGREIEGTHKLRRTDRYRSKGAWFQGPACPPWIVGEAGPDKGPPILVFYSFKGGVGRTTALAAFAIQRAKAAERVVVLDLDLDAPGVGALLAADEKGTTAAWGVVDYLLERPIGEVELRDYYHACTTEAVAGEGEILVVPAGRIDEEYLGKLARVDLEPSVPGAVHPLRQLLEQVRSELRPDWILLDARAGLSDPAGLSLSGLAHLHILFSTTSEQSWGGLRIVIERLGAERVRRNQLQAECLLVHAMVPANPKTAEDARNAFTERALDEFVGHYYAEDPEDPADESFWYVRDSESQDAPHVPVPIHYSERLAFFAGLNHIASELVQSNDYIALTLRITSRFAKVEE